VKWRCCTRAQKVRSQCGFIITKYTYIDNK
jgi:hypothetical protein